jgi:hypothetical protein
VEVDVRSLVYVLAQEPGTGSTTGEGGVHVSPSSAGMPGAELIQTLLGWAQMVALWGSLGALLAGAAIYGIARESGSYGAAGRGKTMVIGGAVGAILAGLAPAAVHLLFEAAQ